MRDLETICEVSTRVRIRTSEQSKACILVCLSPGYQNLILSPKASTCSLFSHHQRLFPWILFSPHHAGLPHPRCARFSLQLQVLFAPSLLRIEQNFISGHWCQLLISTTVVSLWLIYQIWVAYSTVNHGRENRIFFLGCEHLLSLYYYYYYSVDFCFLFIISVITILW